MGVGSAAALILAIVIGIIFFVVTFNWFIVTLAFALGWLVALAIAALIGYVAYRIVLRVWVTAKS